MSPLNLRDKSTKENDVLTSVINSNVEDKQLPTLDNNNSNNNCIAKQNIKQSCPNGKHININHYLKSESKIKSEIGTIPKEPKRSYASFFKTNEPLSTCETTTTGNNSNNSNNSNKNNNNDEKKSSFDKVINIADVKQNDMLDEEEDEYTYTLRLGGKCKRFTFNVYYFN